MYDACLAELDALGIRRAAGRTRLAKATLYMSQGCWDQARDTLEVGAASALAVTCPDYEPTLQAALAVCDLATGQIPAYRHRLAHARGMLARARQLRRCRVTADRGGACRACTKPGVTEETPGRGPARPRAGLGGCLPAENFAGRR